MDWFSLATVLYKFRKFGKDLLLELQRNPVSHVDQNGQEHTSWFAIPQRSSHETHRRAPVHRTTCYIEWEASDHIIHQDAKVVSQVCACDAQSPHRGEDEDIAAGKEGNGERFGERIGYDFRVGRLVLEGAGVAIKSLAKSCCGDL